jgi:hypothetical protein
LDNLISYPEKMAEGNDLLEAGKPLEAIEAFRKALLVAENGSDKRLAVLRAIATADKVRTRPG